MRINLPERITGARDVLFVLHLEFPAAPEERRLEVRTEGNLEALDLRGTGPGGSYVVPAGQRELHVPLRVTADGVSPAAIEVSCQGGPEAGRTERRELSLVVAPAAQTSSGSRLAITLVALLALLGAGLVFGPKLFGGPKAPALVGKTEQAASQAAKAAKFKVRVTETAVESEAQDGTVVRQVPASGASAKEGSTIELFVGRYRPAIQEVPDLVGAEVAHAEAALREAGYQTLVTYRPPPTPDKAGRVLNQSPEGGETLERDRVVELFVGKPAATPAPTPMPGPTPAPTPGPGPEGPDGPVVAPPPPPPPGPAPEPGPVPTPEPTPTPEPGPTPEPTPEPTPTPEPGPTPAPAPAPGDRSVEVPDVVGMTKSAADWKLSEVGLLGEFEELPGTPEQAGRVMRQVPAAGSRLARLSTVKAILGARGSALPQPGPTPGPAPTPTPAPPAPTPGPTPTPAPEPGPIPAPPPTPEPGPTPPPTPAPAPTPTVKVGQVPDTIGLAREEAEALVRQAGFRHDVVLHPTADVEDGRVISQRPSAGETPAPGSIVTLEVARTPRPEAVFVPDVRGVPAAEALATLRASGLQAHETAGGGSAEEQGKVVDQAPPGGTEVSRETWVEVVVARGLGAPRLARGGPPSSSGGLAQPPAVGPGTPTPLVNTPRSARTPPSPVRLPGRDSPMTASVPNVEGQAARVAIDTVLKAGLMPIVENDRNQPQRAGLVVRQTPTGAAAARPGDLVRLGVAVGQVVGERSVVIPMATGADLSQAETIFRRQGLSVEIVELDVPTHPYAGSARVVAQYPVSTVPLTQGKVVTLWIIR